MFFLKTTEPSPCLNIENSDFYDSYKNLAFDILYGGEGTEGYKKAYNEIAERYGDKAKSKEDIDKELVANFTMNNLDEKIINRIAGQNRPLAVRMFNALKTAYNKVKGTITGTEQDLRDIEKALNLFDKALKERRETVDNSNLMPYVDEEGNVRFENGEQGQKKYAIETLPDGKKYVQADRQVIKGTDTKQWAKDVKSYIDNEIRKGKDIQIVADDGDILTITADTSGKARFRNKVMRADGSYRKMTDDEYATKLRAETHIDEISQVSKRGKGITPDDKNHSFAKDGFNYRTAYFKDYDGQYYRLTLSVGINGEINTVYNVGKINETQFPRGSMTKQNESAVGTSASNDNIPQPEVTVKNNNMQKSGKDTMGNNGEQYLLGGESSVVADNKTLAEARKMNLKGEPQAEIFKKTGWYKGLDKKWKKVIDEKDAELFKTDDKQYMLGQEIKIEKADVDAVQNIGTNKGRISVNDFDSNDIKATEKFARKYYAELKEKSPFFRAWFGDWRENDKTPVTVATKKDATRGTTINKDTGWNIQVSGKVFNETSKHNNTPAKIGYHHLENINDIIEKAVLLDSAVFEDIRKSPNSCMMHSLYALSDTGQGTELIKLQVDEIYTPNEDNTIKRAYKLNGYKIIQLKAGPGLGNTAYSPANSTGNIYTVADLFNFVKQNDSEFNPKPSSLLLDEEGKPLVVYHGTNAKFGNVFYDINLEVDSYLPHTENSASDINESTSIDNILQSMETVNDYSMQNDKKYLLGAEVTEETKTDAPEYNSTAKSRDILTRYENDAVRNIAKAMSVSLGTAREFLKPIIQEMSTEYMKTGKLSKETTDRLFEEAYKNGRVINDERSQNKEWICTC